MGAIPFVPDNLFGDAEAVFFFDGKTELNFPEQWQPSLAIHLSHCIARNPKDLRSHVRRIFLEIARNNGQGLFAALLDLFIALGARGLRLRQRMLNISEELLTEDQINSLGENLLRGMVPAGIPGVQGSILGQGMIGNHALVTSGSTDRSRVRDPLIEAREYLEYSQLDDARAVLEQAVLAEPDRADLHLELLDIYRSTRDKASFNAMIAMLEGMDNPLIDEWAKLALLFEDQL